MTVTITFGSVTLMGSDQTPIAGKRKATPIIALTDTLLLSGLHSVQTNPNVGWKEAYDCMGTWTDFLAILGQVGNKQTLTISGTPAGTLTYTNCAISSFGTPTESDNPSYYYWTVEFTRETVT
jgi:hypothetical protein